MTQLDSRACEIERLKQLSHALQAQLQQEQERTEFLQEEHQKALTEVEALTEKINSPSIEQAIQKMAKEHSRLQREAAAVVAVRAELDAYRLRAGTILAETRKAKETIGERITEGLAEDRRCSMERMAKVHAEWNAEKEALEAGILGREDETKSTLEQVAELEQRSKQLRRRTAIARFGRAAAAYQQDLCLRSLQQDVRRERALGLRKLAREKEELDEEITSKREILNKAVRYEELEDERERKDNKKELKTLRDELEDLEDRIESLEERMKQKDILAESAAVAPPPLEEGERVRKWAEAAGSTGSANYKGATQRLQMRAANSVDEQETKQVQFVKNTPAGWKLSPEVPKSASAPTLPSIHGALQGLQERLQGCRIPSKFAA